MLSVAAVHKHRLVNCLSDICTDLARLKEHLLLVPAYKKDKKLRLAVATGHFKLGNIDRARVLFEEYQREFPDVPTVHYFLGAIYEQVGEIEKAIAEYEKELQISPANKTAAQRLRSLKK